MLNILKINLYYLQKISNSFFYSFIFALPWQTVYFLRESFLDGEKWHYGVIGIYCNVIFLVAWIVLELFLQKNNLLKTFTKDKKLFWLTVVFWISIGISVFQANDKILSIYFWTIIFVGLISFWLLKNSKVKIKKIIFAFILTAVIQGVFGLGQFILQDSFSSKWLGVEKHEISRGGTAVIENQNSRYLRAYGSFSHPNVLGGYLALGLIVALGYYLNLNVKKPVRRALDFFLLFSIIIIFSGLIVSFSRSAYLMLALSFSFLTFFIFIKKRECFKKLFYVYFLLFFTALMFFLNYQNLFLTRVRVENRLEQRSISERISQVNDSKVIIKNNFFQGVGAGNYTLFSWQKDLEKRPIWQHQPVHNIYLLIWSELGFFGLLTFGLLISQIIFKSIYFLQIESDFRIFFTVSFFGLLTIGFFDHWIYSSYFGIMIFWFLAGLMGKVEIEIEA
ncbi:MAG: O-antigen ligase family protein [Candidatus Moranbacteria bacterium]|nr:O-antigen ligase family protein [Candidatus Moranbacteria bacterium]